MEIIDVMTWLVFYILLLMAAAITVAIWIMIKDLLDS